MFWCFRYDSEWLCNLIRQRLKPMKSGSWQNIPCHWIAVVCTSITGFPAALDKYDWCSTHELWKTELPQILCFMEWIWTGSQIDWCTSSCIDIFGVSQTGTELCTPKLNPAGVRLHALWTMTQFFRATEMLWTTQPSAVSSCLIRLDLTTYVATYEQMKILCE